MSIEDSLKNFIADEISKRQPTDLQPLASFCKNQNISRVTLWRAEKRGEVKLARIGRKVFVDANQFIH